MRISEKDDRIINEQICSLIKFNLDHKKLRTNLLNSLLTLIDANAPSTIFRLNRQIFFTDKKPVTEKTFDFGHANLPTDIANAKNIKTDLENHIVSVTSTIESKIYRRFDYPNTGVADLRGLYDLVDLLNRKCLRQISKSMVTQVRIKDIMFGWIRCNINEVWIIGLRRFNSENRFSKYEYKVLETFINRFYDFRSSWYGDLSSQKNLNLLTSREQETVYHFICGLKDKETALQMEISKRTLDSHWQNIFNKLGVSDKVSVLDGLGMIRKALSKPA